MVLIKTIGYKQLINYEPEGRAFESLRARHSEQTLRPIFGLAFLLSGDSWVQLWVQVGTCKAILAQVPCANSKVFSSAFRFAAYSTASSTLSALAIPCPAMSMAVPWSTGVRRIGKSTLIFTQLIDRHFPVDGSTLKASNLTGICPWSRNMAITASYCPARNSMNIVSRLATVRRSHGPLKQNTPQLRHSCAGCNLKQCAAWRNALRGSAIMSDRHKTGDVALPHWMAGLLLMVICVSIPPYH